jgi:hypothetical protein
MVDNGAANFSLRREILPGVCCSGNTSLAYASSPAWGCVNLLSNTGACEWGLGLSASVSDLAISWKKKKCFMACMGTENLCLLCTHMNPCIPRMSNIQTEWRRCWLLVFHFDSVTTSKVLQFTFVEHMHWKFAKKCKHDLSTIFVATVQYGYNNLIPNEIASLYNRQNFFVYR